MQVGKKTYILRFEYARQMKEMLVQFNDDETVRVNLERIIPKAISQGFLPASCSTTSVEVVYKGIILNLDLPLREQGVKEHDVITLHDLSDLVKISIRYKPDDCEPILEGITVRPNAVLRDALKDFSQKVQREYTFYGRKCKRYDLIYQTRKLNLKNSLRAQSIQGDIEVVFKPRIWFEWPPRFIWPPGPYTTYLLGVVLLAAIVFIVMLVTRKPEPVTIFNVTVRCTSECKIVRMDEGVIRENEYKAEKLGLGKYAFRVFPRDYPIIDTLITLEPDKTGKHADTVFTIDPAVVYKGQPTIPCKISGWYGEYGRDRIREKLEINKFPVQLSPDKNFIYDSVFYPGIYEIRYGIGRKVLEIRYWGGTRSGEADSIFFFNLGDPTSGEEKNLNFVY